MVSLTHSALLSSLAGAFMWIGATAAGAKALPQNDGFPFGQPTQEDVDRLSRFAKEANFDLDKESTRVCQGNDLEALGRLFSFSIVFRHFDANARTYGQIIYSSFLNIGEQIGVDAYIKVIEKQPPAVQRRIRNFLYYPFYRLRKQYPKSQQQEVRDMYPGLFPSTFEFGRDDSVFEEALKEQAWRQERQPRQGL